MNVKEFFHIIYWELYIYYLQQNILFNFKNKK